MVIVGGFDIHRRQITFDYLDERSGETRHGRIAPADRMLLRGWLEHLPTDTGTSTSEAPGWSANPRATAAAISAVPTPRPRASGSPTR